MTAALFLLLVQAAEYTVAITAVSIAIGIALGTALCAAALSPAGPVRGAARLYISFFRGVPLLVQLLLFYHLLPRLGINVSSVAAAVLALSLCTAAYQAENLRGGFLSVPRGLLEAADMVGMTALQRFLRVQAPIAIRLTIPAMVNEAIQILHASALISVVGVIELTKTARDLSASTYLPLPIYACAGLLYLVMTLGLVGLGRYSERRLRVA
ncbi:MAG: amino acid ABC transporter permease [Janthinobacterium lividum]